VFPYLVIPVWIPLLALNRIGAPAWALGICFCVTFTTVVGIGITDQKFDLSCPSDNRCLLAGFVRRFGLHPHHRLTNEPSRYS
jgi:hypothetical protein